MQSTITVRPGWSGGDGYRGELPLERGVEHPILLDARELVRGHPLFVIRLRLFLDWHIALGHDVTLLPPRDPADRQWLADTGLVAGLPDTLGRELPEPERGSRALLPLRRLRTPLDVEAASQAALDVLHTQAPALAAWGDPVYMAVSELCGNALQHGNDDSHGGYVMADRAQEEVRQFRLAVADLGIGIPEHIRSRHPDWHDDNDAITRALVRGVTGTNDPHRGNGFAEVFDDALERQLHRVHSAVTVDIRSGAGRIVVDLVDHHQKVDRRGVRRSRRGTWITYTVTTV